VTLEKNPRDHGLNHWVASHRPPMKLRQQQSSLQAFVYYLINKTCEFWEQLEVKLKFEL